MFIQCQRCQQFDKKWHRSKVNILKIHKCQLSVDHMALAIRNTVNQLLHFTDEYYRSIYICLLTVIFLLQNHIVINQKSVIHNNFYHKRMLLKHCIHNIQQY